MPTRCRINPANFAVLLAGVERAATRDPMVWAPLLRYLQLRRPYAYGGAPLYQFCLTSRPDLAADLRAIVTANLDTLHYSAPTFPAWFTIYQKLSPAA